MNHYVYEITNLVNGKKYIGKRSCKCAIEDDKYMGSGKYLRNAINKYGKENFKKEILEICSTEKYAFNREEFYIKSCNAHTDSNYYNIASGGEGGRGNFESKSQDELDAIYKKISESLLGKYAGKNNPMSRKVICVNDLKTFNTIKDASSRYLVSPISIARCCRGYSSCIDTKYGLKVFMYHENFLNLNNNQITHILETCDKKRFENNKVKVILLNTLQIFDTLGDASKFIGKSISSICAACKNSKRSAGKVNGDHALWAYYDDYVKLSKNQINERIEYFYKNRKEVIINRSSKIVCLNTSEVFDSVKDAENKYKITNISACCRGVINVAGKIDGEYSIWRYYNDYINMTDIQIQDELKIINRVRTGENNANSKKIILLNTLEVFECMKDACIKFKLSPGNLTNACSGKKLSCGKDTITKEKLKWMYYDDYLKQQDSNAS